MTNIFNIMLCVCYIFHFNNKYMIALTQITNTEIFPFIAVLVFKLLSPKVLFVYKLKRQ